MARNSENVFMSWRHHGTHCNWKDVLSSPDVLKAIGWTTFKASNALQWRHNKCDGVSNRKPHDYLLSRLFRRRSKENIQAPRHWPLWGEFTGDCWTLRTKGQWRGKCFHLMTSSWPHGNIYSSYTKTPRTGNRRARTCAILGDSHPR